MCLVPNCHGKSLDGSKNWGLSTGICQHHYDQIAAYIRRPEKRTFEAKLLDDYVKLKALMLDSATVMKCLQKLDGEVGNALNLFNKKKSIVMADRFDGGTGNDEKYVRLSRVLSYYERYCWFPSSHIIFVDQLSGDDFLWYLTHGYMVKDTGAGFMHGDFVHRLQWHAVMRVITNDFTTAKRPGWNYSPLQLYVSFGKDPALAANSWFLLFDLTDAAQGSFLLKLTPPGSTDSAKNLVPSRDFSVPTALTAAVNSTDGLKTLKAHLVRRYEKRKAAEGFARNVMNRVKDSGSTILGGKRIRSEDVFNVLYRWRKTGGRPAPIAWPPAPGATRDAIIEALASMAWDDMLADVDGSGTKFTTTGARHNTIYQMQTTPVDSKQGQVYMEASESPVTDDDINTRISSSAATLNPEYHFVKTVGVLPAHA